MRSLTQQLSDAFLQSGLSVAELLAKSGLPVSRTTLGRKLRGKIPLSTPEAEQLAVTLGVTLVWDPGSSRAA